MNKPVLPMSSLSLTLPNADGSIETYRLAAFQQSLRAH